MLSLGNARVSPLNDSAEGEAPNGESLSLIDGDDGAGDDAAGVDGRCISSKFMRGNARVSPLNAGGCSSQGDAGAAGAADCAGTCCVVLAGAGALGAADGISSNESLGNDRVSPLNDSAEGDAPNGSACGRGGGGGVDAEANEAAGAPPCELHGDSSDALNGDDGAAAGSLMAGLGAVGAVLRDCSINSSTL